MLAIYELNALLNYIIHKVSWLKCLFFMSKLSTLGKNKSLLTIEALS